MELIPRWGPRGRAHRARLRLPVASWLVCLLLSSCLGAPTQGPTIHISDAGWTAEPPTTTQEGSTFELTLVNSLDVPVSFVVVHMNYGQPTDLRLVDGVPDVDRGADVILGEGVTPDVMGPLVVAYYLVYPDVDQVTLATAPTLEPGAEMTVRVGNPGLGGGDPGRYAVISYEPEGLERGDYVLFDLADSNGEVPRASPVDYCIPDPYEPLRIGDPLPPWQGLLLDGGTFDSGSLADNPTLILVDPAHPSEAFPVLEVFSTVVDGHQGALNAVMVKPGPEEGLGDVLTQAGVAAPVVVEDFCELQAIFRIGWEQPPYWIVTDGEGVIRGLAYGPRTIEEVDALIDETVGPLP